MTNLQNTKKLVTAILENDKRTRNCDSFLYLQVIRVIAERENINLDGIPVTSFLLNMNQFPFPPFESVRRTRQKVQEKCPWLAECPEVQEFRAENEEVYRDFATSN